MRVRIDPLQPESDVRSKGVYYTRSTRWGPIVQKWPTKKPIKKTPYRFYQETEFGIAAAWASSPHPLDYATATEMVKGTEYVPRDFLMMCIYGLAYQVEFEDGRAQWEYYRMVAPNAQLVLDQVTDVTGSLIYRSTVGWIGIPPGSAGYVLTMEGGSPAWRAGGGGGGGGGSFEIITDQTIAAPTAAIDVSVLGLSQALVQVIGVPASSSGQRVLRVSVDGGSTYFSASGNYQAIQANGSESASSVFATHSTSASGNRSFIAQILNISAANMLRTSIGSDGITRYLAASEDPITHLRIENTAGNLTGGRVIVLGF